MKLPSTSKFLILFEIINFIFSFEKLGWFRVNPENEAFVQGGFVLMDKIHKAKAENCLEQKYQSILDANYYVNKNSNVSFRESFVEFKKCLCVFKVSNIFLKLAKNLILVHFF